MEEKRVLLTEYLPSIIQQLPFMVFVKDAQELRFLLLNKAGEEMIGYSQAEMLGKNDYDFFPYDEADFFKSKDRKVLEGGKVVDIPEEHIQTKNNGKLILHTQKIPLLDLKGTPIFLIGISQDITDK